MAHKKPSVAHLREFRALVWVLLQGQKKTRKILPKSTWRAYIGFDDGLQSVQYYNSETRKTLTSWNYHFLSLPERDTPLEEIKVMPNTPHEGESEGSTPLMSTKKGDSLKRKWIDEEDKPLDPEPKKKRGI